MLKPLRALDVAQRHLIGAFWVEFCRMLAHWSLRARVYALANMWFRGTHLQWPEPSTLNIQPTNLTKALPKPPTPQYKGHTMIYRYKAGSDSEAAYIVPLLIF